MITIGNRKVRAQKAGFVEAKKTISTNGGVEATVELVLTKIVHEGRVAVNAGARDTITMDGRVVGVGAWSGTLPSGGHTLRVTAPNMRPYQNEIVVSDDQPREIAVTLEPEAMRIPTWAWIAGGVLATGGLAVGGYFMFRQEPTYEGPAGNLTPWIVQTSRPSHWR